MLTTGIIIPTIAGISLTTIIMDGIIPTVVGTLLGIAAMDTTIIITDGVDMATDIMMDIGMATMMGTGLAMDTTTITAMTNILIMTSITVLAITQVVQIPDPIIIVHLAIPIIFHSVIIIKAYSHSKKAIPAVAIIFLA